MRKLTLILLFSSLLLTSLSTQTIGLTLSGGGAKGLAHIGVLEEFEKAGIYPQVVSGTSMGSIVGGLYAIGYSPAELREFATTLDWDSYFTDVYPREFVPIEERQRSDRYQLSFPIVDGGLQLPLGLLRGRRIQTLLGQLTVDAHGINDFDDFRYPFRAVATDLETGEAFVFERGNLREAIRASMAIPSVFAPVLTSDDRLLVDGLVVRNLPVQDAEAMGADFLVAVDVGAPLFTREELTSLLAIVGQTSSFVGAISIKEERARADFIIDPPLDPYTTLSYQSADSIINRGAAAARAALPDLIRKLDSLGIERPLIQPDFQRESRDSFFITNIVLTADTTATETILRRLLDIQAPGLLTKDQLEHQINLLYGSGFFDLIDFELRPVLNGRELHLHALGRPQWRNRYSINYDSDYDAALLVNMTGRNVGARGSLLALDLKISENPAASFEYLLFTRSKPRIGLRLQGNVRFYPGREYQGSELANEFKFHESRLQLSGLLSLSNNRSLEIGISSERLSQNPRFFRLSGSTDLRRQTAVSALLTRDTYDRTFFPHSGSLSIIEVKLAVGGQLKTATADGPALEETLGDNWRLIGRLDKVFPLGNKIALNGGAKFGLINSPTFNLTNQLYLGRQVTDDLAFFDQYGYRYMEAPVSAFYQLGAELRFEFGKDNFLSIGYDFAQVAISQGPILLSDQFLRLDPNRLNRNLQGIGLQLGTLTAFGPFQFSAEYQIDNRRMNYFLHGGYYF